MNHSIALENDVTRTDLEMADGRTIRYYDQGATARSAVDKREAEVPAGIGELRHDALLDEWVAVASHRQHRIFLPPKELCPLCPTKSDLLTEIPDSTYQVAVFDNRSPSLNTAKGGWSLPEFDGVQTPVPDAVGKCEVVAYTDSHEGSLGELDLARHLLILTALRDRTSEISKLPNIVQVFPFENRGEEVGVTLDHPHGQIYAYSYLTPRTRQMLGVASNHLKKTGRVLLDDIVLREIKDEIRIVTANEHWLAFVPFASRFPFEIHVAPKQSVADLTELSLAQCAAYPEIAKEVLLRLDGVFGMKMAYMAGWHQAPVSIGRDALRLHWQITSVRRAPGKLKYFSGSESMMGAFIQDVPPEQAALQLREVKL